MLGLVRRRRGARSGQGRAMSLPRLCLLMALALALAAVLAITLGETAFSLSQYGQALLQPASPPGEVLWTIRAPRVTVAALVGAALGMAGATLQGLLRNPLADPGVLGVSAVSGLGAALAISAGLAVLPGAIELSALAGALVAGGAVVAVAARFREPEALILFGVALSAFGGALTALVFNLSPSPVATAEILAWLMGSVENRDLMDALRALIPMAIGVLLCLRAGAGLRMLTLGEDAARMSALPMARLRIYAVAGSALLTGAAVAASGVIGFVGLAAPHLVRALVRDDPKRILWPAALAGALLVVLADLAARMIPTEQELKLGVVTALFGAPVFALLAWRAARSWRS
ncbi:MAG: FecCD family ABC transporter permease [Caulobacter sp.]